MTTGSKIRCASCNKKVGRHEPDIVLVDIATGEKRFYHERCGPAAYSAAFAARPAVVRVVHRYADPEAN